MQAALAEFISSGAFARHIRRMRRTYAERHQLVVSIVDSNFADCLVRIPSAAGIHVTGLLRPEVGRSDDEIVRLALRRGGGRLPAGVGARRHRATPARPGDRLRGRPDRPDPGGPAAAAGVRQLTLTGGGVRSVW